MSHYEVLSAVWRRERKEDALNSLEDDFYQKTRDYINHLETQSNIETDELIGTLFKKRWMRTNYLINDLITLRIEKHISEALSGNNMPEPLPKEEQIFRKNLEQQISTFRDSVLGIEKVETKVEKLDSENDYQLVMFTQKENIQSVGADLKTYGPFAKGDIALLPVENARNYILRSKVQIIDLDK